MMANANGQRQSVRDLQTTATTRRAGKASPVTTALRSRDPVSAIARKYNTSNAVSAQATTTQPYRQKRLSDLTTLYQSGRDVVKREISSRDVLAGVDGNLLSTLRDRCSTFLFVQSLIILCEATLLSISLLSRTLAVNTGDPLGHSFELPAPIHGLDLHLLFSLHFWVPFLIWAATSVLLPAAAGSIFNFTRRRTQVDPVGFNLVKAILAIFMLGQGLAGPGRVARLQIEKAFPGGWRFILTDCLVAGIVAFWDGVQLQGQVINHAAR
ncbi:hypothetical protein K470DRAFT_90235 [Piedraia hortae CBS 480.64]|uniref:Uncharacterized protein n=1 Tax=Piedraia hortae CBS 480.64 TaxID=1314780 RepID=A0A6A7BWS0_9PEZI|nr:hypothetical protein K470DRAFT_90235 [Piedraia hortae CBS 480.64]